MIAYSSRIVGTFKEKKDTCLVHMGQIRAYDRVHRSSRRRNVFHLRTRFSRGIVAFFLILRGKCLKVCNANFKRVSK